MSSDFKQTLKRIFGDKAEDFSPALTQKLSQLYREGHDTGVEEGRSHLELAVQSGIRGLPLYEVLADKHHLIQSDGTRIEIELSAMAKRKIQDALAGKERTVREEEELLKVARYRMVPAENDARGLFEGACTFVERKWDL